MGDDRRVLVIGAGLAGMAAAARLAKAGHRVEVFEARDRVGGMYAAEVLRPSTGSGRVAQGSGHVAQGSGHVAQGSGHVAQGSGHVAQGSGHVAQGSGRVAQGSGHGEPGSRPGGEVLVDAAPAVIGFPAPWRDLFRKSGRPMDAEMARAGMDLVPAAPARHRFADGTELVLPTDRGDQLEALGEAYGRPVAERWRGFVDHLDDVWQALRPLGLESELRDRDQLRAVPRKLLRPRHSVETLARGIGEPHLADIIRGVAYRLGSPPGRTPAFCAVQLSVERRFGRWTVVTPTEQGRTSTLVELLAERLRLRRVPVRLETPVLRIRVDDTGRAVGVTTADGDLVDGAAVICTADPWQSCNVLLANALLDRSAVALRRAVNRLSPARHPSVRHELLADGCTEVTETISYDGSGVPVVTFDRPVGTGTVRSSHDHRVSTARPGAGVAWNGFRSWLHRPPVTTSVPGLFLAGPFSRGGAGLSQTLLSGALASYGCHDLLG
ncbi:hypothetical protein GCM10009841_16260 [Microlunatus panaciterrae]|uniref:4,4'-diaponeurosporene oxygenase n=1 Tax=Microlunatus panaciterrae TaxID=400768 RepID=A0ABS2RMF0_9ACTN|nr:FAD-dependent oxidoreductase [Microlunatus panaciterrae]MBM7800184.1 phytoene dehydrogenase-like protein [Microlunatus panaciterrae]